MEIKASIRIPYDIDPWFGWGCGDSDLWADDYGDGVRLMISDAGSAYLCPDNFAGDWRIYVGPGGARKITGLHVDGDNVASVGAMAELLKIVDCAFESGQGDADAVRQLVSIPQAEDPIQFGAWWPTLNGVSVDFSMEMGAFLKIWSDESFRIGDYTKYVDIDDMGIATTITRDCSDFSDLGPICEESDAFLGADKGTVESMREFIGERQGDPWSLKKMGMLLALSALERSAKVEDEIETFEKACR